MCQVFMLEISIPVWNLNSVYNGGLLVQLQSFNFEQAHKNTLAIILNNIYDTLFHYPDLLYP